MLTVTPQIGQDEPLHIRAEGIVSDGIVEFLFGQKSINTALTAARAAHSAPRLIQFLRWHPTLDRWSVYPKPGQRAWLHPGECVLYCELEVIPTARIEDLKREVLRSMLNAAPGLTRGEAANGKAGANARKRIRSLEPNDRSIRRRDVGHHA